MGCYPRGRMRKPTSLLSRLALAGGAPLLVFGLVEAGFRVAGYSYQPSPMDLLVSGAGTLRDATMPDDDVFWTLKRSQRYRFADIEIVTNELGTRDRLPPRAKAPGTFRIICLGDSTAFGGHTTYPAQLEQVLRTCSPGVTVEVINAGVPGWSTYQGLRLFQRDLAAWQPDVVTASFGFNNAKREADGKTDRQRAEAANAGASRLARWLRHSRFVQWLVERRDARRDSRVRLEAPRDWLQLRCPPNDHARCLRELEATCRGIGAKLLLATQPHGFTWKDGDPIGKLPPAAIQEVATRLDEQNAVVARSASELGVGLVDVAAQFRALDARDVYVDALPGNDPLHTTAFGARRLAEALADAMLDAKWIEPQQRAPTRPFQRCGPIAPLAYDVDGDERDEVLLAAVVDGGLRVRMFDPKTGTTTELNGSMPPPDAAFELAQVSVLGNRLLLSVPFVDPDAHGFLVVDERGEVMPLGKRSTALPRHVAYQVLPIDLEGDGAVEYAVSATGAGGTPWIMVMSQVGEPLFGRSAKRDDWSAGVRLQAIEDGARSSVEAIAVTPCAGPAFVLEVSGNGTIETLLAPRYLGRFAPTELVAGRFARPETSEEAPTTAGGEPFMLVHAPMIVSWRREFLSSAFFPFGSGTFDREAVRPVLTRITRAGKRVVVLGSRVGATIHLFGIEGTTITPMTTIAIPTGS
ncbi:MAG: hypothetical protein IT459_01855 [Planctomycetes bacterium]|nr:hypothetical protein [Planctomycetota bacterium]